MVGITHLSENSTMVNLPDRIEEILSRDSSDMFRIRKQTKALEELFIEALFEATTGAVIRLNQKMGKKGGIV